MRFLVGGYESQTQTVSKFQPGPSELMKLVVKVPYLMMEFQGSLAIRNENKDQSRPSSLRRLSLLFI